jgi:cytochrome c-type biogenesis protein CcsB
MTDTLFYWIAVGSYVASSIVYVAVLIFEKEKFRKWGVSCAVAGLFFHTISLAVRWVETGHGPYISTYEIVSSDVWIAVLFFLVFQWRFKKFANSGILVMPLSFLLLGFALMGSKEVRLLPPSLRSPWLFVHIIFAKIALAALLIAVAFSIISLLKNGKDFFSGKIISKMPRAEILDDYTYRLVALGFVSLTIMIISGAIWGNYAWGSYWSWDSAQTWSLAVWFIYGIYLHGRMTFHWRGDIAAWYIIFAFIFSIVAFFVIPYFVKGLHSQYMAR